jgi:hypothetical protein
MSSSLVFQSKELQTEPLTIYLDDIVNKVIYKFFNMLPFFFTLLFLYNIKF